MVRKLKLPTDVETRTLVLEPLPLIGESPVFKAMLERVHLLAPLQRPLLITGPTGSGKEAIAQLTHRVSGLAGAHVAVNCATVPEEIAEAEFFGYQRGAFTGAQEDHIGLVGQAENGTLFLDEVAELPMPLQLKLLRILQDGSYRRLGSTVELKANIRIIAATNRPLEPLIAKGLFREDLFYRLRMLRLELPALHERADDAILIARHFLLVDRDLGPRSLVLSRSACQVLREYPWPGNVRELQSTLLEASLFVTKGTIEGAHLEAVLHWKHVQRDITEILLELFQRKGASRVHELRSLTGLTSYKFQREVKKLESRGLISVTGTGRAARYSVVIADRGQGAKMGDEPLRLDAHRTRQILQAVTTLGQASRRDLARTLQISNRTINRELRKLEKAGMLRPDGRGRSTRYLGVEGNVGK